MRKTFKLEVKEEVTNGVSRYYFSIPNELSYNLKWYPGDIVTWYVNGDYLVVYKDKGG